MITGSLSESEVRTQYATPRMGTRIHVYLSHDLPSIDEPIILSRLASTLQPALAVQEYWRSVGPVRQELQQWHAEAAIPALPNQRAFEGPGSLMLTVTKAAARISTGGRWRGFLSIAPLREVHMRAFMSLAMALGSPELVLCHSQRDDVNDIFLNNGSQADGIDRLQAVSGPPLTSIGPITPDVVAETNHALPGIWFLIPVRS